MAKRTKSEAQLRYKELYGKEPEGSMTVKQLEAAIKEREDEIKIDDPANNTSEEVELDSEKLDMTDYSSEEGVAYEAEPAALPPSEPSEERIWTTDPSELVSVENRKSRIKLKGGKETDLTEYYGVKK